ncbi:PREDICTED: zinc finger protein with KRAB and SCAN domains 2-like [Amphimedon queenslandica]|nr:PREDICTED: zinc finger protein with KRAB and SCAN domains 2-like [Amphimedon queenslandica]|eukprot:XP_011406402.1 PREDICTED: zinc finger protein with KRAB and SCAN domains 2-like [Amphimedon queenslandica]
MATIWCDEESHKLLELWGEEGIQAQLEGCTRNKHIYEKVSKSMEESGYSKTAIQCREKIKKLKKDYKKVKDKNIPTGTGTTVWKFYDAVNDILGNKPATHPPVVIDTSVESVRSQVTHIMNRSEDFDNSSSSGALETEYDGDDWSFVETESGTTIDSATEGKINEGKVETKPKRKRGKEDKYERAISVFEKVLAQSKDADGRFFELEEKRLKLEERQLEFEDRRLREEQEREAQRRREEREFQQNLFALCSRHMPLYNHFNAPFKDNNR